MDNSLLAVRGINHKYIVVGGCLGMHQIFKNILCAVSVSVVMMGAFSLSAHAQEEVGTAGSSLGKEA